MRADARKKRDQIITAALQQIQTRPNSEITLEGIAADAGVGIATLYRHFPSRASLYDACAIVYIDDLQTLLDDTLADFHRDPQGSFERFVWAIVDSGVGMLATALTAPASSSNAATPSCTTCNYLSTKPCPTTSSPPAKPPYSSPPN